MFDLRAIVITVDSCNNNIGIILALRMWLSYKRVCSEHRSGHDLFSLKTIHHSTSILYTIQTYIYIFESTHTYCIILFNLIIDEQF